MCAVEHPDQTPAEPFRNLRVAVGAEPHPPPLVHLRHHPHLGGAAADAVGRDPVGVEEGREEGGVVEKAFDAVDGLGERGELGGEVVKLVGDVGSEFGFGAYGVNGVGFGRSEGDRFWKKRGIIEGRRGRRRWW